MFDRKRHKEFMHLPMDWPRINQFPEYYTIEKEKKYSIGGNIEKVQIISGRDLQHGYPVKLKKGIGIKLIVRAAAAMQ